jgi:DNA invertase Pin-like site-specific DNA recombinase
LNGAALGDQILAIVGDKAKTESILTLIEQQQQAEKASLHRKQAEGIAAARANGVVFGRKKLARTQEFEMLKEMYTKKQISARQAAKRLGIGHATFLRWLREETELSK